MDITKYLKNKDIKLKNEDFDVDAMFSEVRKGYIREEDIAGKLKAQEQDFENKLAKEVADRDNTIQVMNKNLESVNLKSSQLNFENRALKKGFNAESIEDVARLRKAYSDIEDDDKALDVIIEKYKSVYFKDTNSNVPNEKPISSNGTTIKKEEVNRKNTSYKSLFNFR